MAWALTLCFLATSGTDTLSASRRIATICSSVKRLFFIGSSLVGGSHSLKLRLVLRTWAGQTRSVSSVSNRVSKLILSGRLAALPRAERSRRGAAAAAESRDDIWGNQERTRLRE